MQYIFIKFEGQKTFGGYIEIDGNGREIKLYDGQIIEVSQGYHHIAYHSMSRLQKSENDFKLNSTSDLARNRAIDNMFDAVDATISHSFEADTIMMITVVSDNRGRILEAPRYTVRELTPEILEEVNKIKEQNEKKLERIRKENAERKEAERHGTLIKNAILAAVCAILFFIVFLGGGAVILRILLGGLTIWRVIKLIKEYFFE